MTLTEKLRRRTLKKKSKASRRLLVEGLERRLLLASDIAITKTDGMTYAHVGEDITYTIEVSNQGPDGTTTDGVQVNDTFPSMLTNCNWTSEAFGGASGNSAAGSGDISDAITLPNGGSVTYTATCTVAESAYGTLSNTATATAVNGTTDNAPANNSATDDDTDLGVATGPAFSKVFTPNVIGPGGVSTATFTITNSTAAPVTDISFTDVLPIAPGPLTIADPANASTSCDLGMTGSLSAPDGGSTIALSGAQIGAFQSCTVTVDVTASTPGAHTNPEVTLSSSAGNNTSSETDLTVATDRPSFSKSFTPSSISVGERSTLTLTVDNSLNASDLSSVVFSDPLPAGMQIADPPNISTTCGGPNPQLTAAAGGSVVAFQSFGLLFPGFEVLLAGETCSVAVDVIATAAGSLDNVTSELTTNVGSSGKASDTLEVSVTPLAIQKSFTDDPVPPGSPVTLDFTVTNFERTFSATDIAFTDDLSTLVPALPGLTFSSLLSNDCGGSVAGVGGTTIGLSGGTLAPESSCTVSVSLSVPVAATPGVYTNTTSAVAGTVDGSPVSGNTASEDLFVVPFPLLSKSFVDDPVNPGDTVDLEFTIVNTSPTSSATDIAFEDEVPTIIQSVVTTPGSDPCGTGSMATFSPLIDDPDGTIPARIALSGGTLAPAGMPGDSCTFTFTLDVSGDAAPGLYPNVTSEVTATVDGATVVGPEANDSLTVISAPTLSKTFVDDPVIPGDSVTLEFTLEYPADATGNATGITFSDDLAPVLGGLTANLPASPDPPCGAGSSLSASAGDTLLTLMDGTLIPGESCTFSVTLNVPAGAPSGTFTNTTSGVSATVEGVTAVSAPATDGLIVSGLTFSKEFVGGPVFPGEATTLRFTLENVSPTDDVTSISFTDDLGFVLPGVPDLTVIPPLPTTPCGPGSSISELGPGFLIFAGGSLMQGDPPCSFDVGIQVPAGIDDGEHVNTTGSLTAVIGGSLAILPPAQATLSVDSTRLLLSKEFTDDPVAPGDSVTLEFTVTNLDPAQAAADVAFDDDLAAVLPDLTYDSLLLNDCGGLVEGIGTTDIMVSDVSLAASGTCTIRVSLDVPAAAPDGLFTNTTSEATGTMSGFPVRGDAVSDDLQITSPLLFSKSFDGPTLAGGTPVLTFTLTNPRATAEADLSFTDDLSDVISGLEALGLPANDVCGEGSVLDGTSFLTLTGASLAASGGMCSFDVTLAVPVTATAGTFPNTTSELFQQGLPLAEPATADLIVQESTDISVTKTDGVTSATPGESVIYTITVANAGPDNDPAVTLTDTFPSPPLTCSYTSVAAGGATGNTAAGAGNLAETLSMPVGSSVTYTATCSIDADATGTLSNTATATASITDTDPGNDSATDSDTVLAPEADLSIIKSNSSDPAVAGTDLTYTMTVTNNGPSSSTGGTVTDVLPAGLTFSSSSDCTEAAGTVTCAIGALGVGASQMVSFVTTVDPTYTGGISNTATVAGNETDPDSGNDSAMSNTTVIGRDFGDAPATYGTAAASHGDQGPRLGAERDIEFPASISADATGDDTDVAADDEDGVTMLSFIEDISSMVSIDVQNVTGSATVQGWIDWNANDVFDDPAELVVNQTVAADGVIMVPVTPPLGSVAANPDAETFARFRVSNDGGLTPTDASGDGEIEDYRVSIVCGLEVINTNDSGGGSLREAINCSNSTAGIDTITFNIPGAGPHTIQPNSALPVVTDPVIIDGTSEPDFAGTPVVEIDGSNAGPGVHGLQIDSGDSTVRGLAVNRFSFSGIVLAFGGGNTIQQNMVGTDPSGTVALGNGSHGVVVFDSANNMVGGSGPDDGNVISGNGVHGAVITRAGSTGNRVQGNRIGVAADGVTPLGNNRMGVRIDQGAGSNTIGGVAPGEGNIIAHQTLLQGVVVAGNSTGNAIQRNSMFSNGGLGIDLNGDGVTPNDVTVGSEDSDTGPNQLQNAPVLSMATLVGTELDLTVVVPSATTHSAYPLTIEFFTSDAAGEEGERFLNAVTYQVPASPTVLWMTSDVTGLGVAAGSRLVATATDSAGNTSEFSAPVTVTANNPDLLNVNDDFAFDTGATFHARITGGTPGTQHDQISVVGTVDINNATLDIDDSGFMAVGDEEFVLIDNDGSDAVTGTFSGLPEGTQLTVGGEVFELSYAAGDGNDVVLGRACSLLVTRTDDIGFETLRRAIECANDTAGTDTITFDIPGAGPHTIQPNSGLPVVTDPVMIDGTSEPDFAGTPVVEIDGSNAGAGVHGLQIDSGGSTVRGLAVNRFSFSGIVLAFGGGNTIQQNMVGTDPSGTVALGNGSHGVVIFDSASNMVGGPGPNDGNVISGNGVHGAVITRAGSTGNVVQGNRIGVAADGVAPLGNNRMGVRIDRGASGNTLGGTGAGEANIIAHNATQGVAIFNTSPGNAIQRNSMFSNGGLGIDLNGDGTTPNDVPPGNEDADTGPNQLQNSPVLVTATLNGTDLEVNYGVPSAIANSAYPLTVEFFIADAAGQEGELFLAAQTYNQLPPPAIPVITIDVTELGVSVATEVVASATDSNGNTSEFSAPISVSAPLTAASASVEVARNVPDPAVLQSSLQPIVNAAVNRWQQAGIAASQLSRLHNIDVSFAELDGAYLGLATGDTIRLDSDAAGHGWYVDPTPMDDSEFRAESDNADAAQRMDLLTAVMHEMGHALGFSDEFDDALAEDLMFAWLTPGSRRAP